MTIKIDTDSLRRKVTRMAMVEHKEKFDLVNTATKKGRAVAAISAPVKTGALRRSIRTKKATVTLDGNIMGSFGTSKHYAGYQEFGFKYYGNFSYAGEWYMPAKGVREGGFKWVSGKRYMYKGELTARRVIKGKGKAMLIHIVKA